MREAFITIMNMNIAASCMILITLGIRAIWKRAPHRLFLILWGLVAVRLLCPVMLNSEFGLLPEIRTQNSARQEADSENMGIVIPDIKPGGAGESRSVDEEYNGSAPANPAGTENSGNNISFSKEVFIIIAWMVGAVVILAYTAADYLKVYRRLKDAQPFDCGQKDIYLSHNIETALLFGLLRPRIYLPADLEEMDWAYVIRHERKHFQNGDHWWKLLSVLVLALHWFNPLVWVGFAVFSRDIEYACDEAVIQSLDKDGRRRYAHCLIDCSTINNHWGIVSLSFGKDVTKMRVKNIVNYTKTKKGTLIVLGVIVCLIAILFMTTRTSAESEQQVKPHRSDTQPVSIEEKEQAEPNSENAESTDKEAKEREETDSSDEAKERNTGFDNIKEAVRAYAGQITSALNASSTISFFPENFATLYGYYTGLYYEYQRELYIAQYGEKNAFDDHQVTGVVIRDTSLIETTDDSERYLVNAWVNYYYTRHWDPELPEKQSYGEDCKFVVEKGSDGLYRCIDFPYCGIDDEIDDIVESSDLSQAEKIQKLKERMKEYHKYGDIYEEY